MNHAAALIADSMVNVNEFLVWLAIFLGLFLFHTLLNAIIQPGRSAREREDGLRY